MADVSVTAGSVLASAAAVLGYGTAGETIAQGDVVYLDTSSNTIRLADADAAATASAVGVALNAADAGQPVTYATYDPDFTPGGTLSLSAAGSKGLYVVSTNAGKIAPSSDMASGKYPTILMVAKSTTKAILKIIAGPTVLGA